MKVSTNWVKAFVPLDDLDPSEVMDRITIKVAEVEEVEVVGEHLSHVITARVQSLSPHPNADKLKLVRVDYGISEMEVVCGAPNVATGQVVALAKAGTELPSGKLKVSSIRGVRSEGMICAEDELGLSEDHEGILVFPEGTPIGVSLDKILGPPDIILDIDNKSLTHRPDLWGHLGFAREFAAAYGKPFRSDMEETIDEKPEKPDPLVIENREFELCPRYSALVVDGLSVRSSPNWMQRRLSNVGIRPINNIVDTTNYVMLELGQPMHAFDRRQIKGDKIVIRRANQGEDFTTLDGNKHKLTDEVLVIADSERAVALAGVMGGENSEIVDDTTCIVIESANFHPTNIRRTATRYDLRTDSSQRFEKGQDPTNTTFAIVRILELLKETCPDARVTSDLMDSYPKKPDPVVLTIDIDFINDRLGERLPDEQIIGILESLQFGIKPITRDTLRVSVPSWRAKDVTIKADIVEEIGRIYGYDNIVPRPPLVSSDPPEVNEQRRFEWLIRDIFCGRLGFDEVSNYSFVSEKGMLRCGLDPEPCLRLVNPLASHEDRMRTSLVPQIVANIETNQKHFESFRIFEIGRTTHKKDRKDSELATEKRKIAGAIFGEGDNPFFSVKGTVEELLTLLRIEQWKFDRSGEAPPWAHPGRWAKVSIGDIDLGILAELHPRIANEFELKQRAAIFDLDADLLFDTNKKQMLFETLRRHPVNPIEITVVIDRRRPVAEIEKVIEKSGADKLVSFKHLYNYEGERIDEAKKAVTYHVVFGADGRTLTGEEVAKLHEDLVNELRKAEMPLRSDA